MPVQTTRSFIIIAPAEPRNSLHENVLLFFYRKIPRLLGSVKFKKESGESGGGGERAYACDATYYVVDLHVYAVGIFVHVFLTIVHLFY